MWVDKKNLNLNGVAKKMDQSPQIIMGRTMIPIRFAVENLGCQVIWNNIDKTITIYFNK